MNYVDRQPARCHGWDCKLCLLEEWEKVKEKKFYPFQTFDVKLTSTNHAAGLSQSSGEEGNLEAFSR